MRSCKCLLLSLLMFGVLNVSAEEAVDVILEKSRKVVKEAESDLKEWSPQAAEQLGETEWMNPRAVSSDQIQTDGETAQSRGWNALAKHAESQSAQLAAGQPKHPAVPDDVVYVFFSLSMPEASIKTLFFQALNQKDHRRIVFVLRGWDHPGPNSMVVRLNKLFPEAEKLGELPNVQINPVLFENNDIDRVPTFVAKDNTGVWRRIIGETSLADAMDRLAVGKNHLDVIGPTFEIEEPNVLKLIQARIAEVDWTQQVQAAAKRALIRPTTGRALPDAEETETYLVDLTIVNRRDLAGDQGEVFAKAGTTINPFDYMTTPQRFVFFDANKAGHVEQAKAWRDEFEFTTLITTVPVGSMEERRKVLEMLRQPVHEINDMLIERFRLKAVPSLAYQDGRMLRVDVVSVDDQKIREESSVGGE